MQHIYVLQQLSTMILAGVDDTDFAKKLTDLYREGLSDKKIAERMQVEGIKIR